MPRSHVPTLGARALVIALSLSLLAAACSDDDGDGGGDDSGAPTTEESTTTGSSTTEGSTTTTTTAPEVEAAFTEAPTCEVQLPEGVGVTPRCGTVAVPLDYDDPTGETIDIAVVVFPAAPEGGAEPAPDPVILLGGGPGQKSVEGAGTLIASSAPVLRQRDLVVFDQRGVGASSPALECPQLDALAGEQAESASEEAVAAAEQCHTQLTESGIDLSAFDTAANVEDIDVIRRALDYEKINLYGTSYGARLALQYARDHSDNLRAQVLNSPVPAEANFIADAAASLDMTIEALFSACEDDAACAAANPDLAANLDKVVAAVEQQPPTVQIVDIMTGQMRPVVVTPAILANSVFSFFYLTPLIGALPQAVTAAAAGDLTPLIQGGTLFSQVAAVTKGMQLSFTCAEELAEADPDQVAEEAEELSTVAQSLVATVFEGFVRQCEVWDVEPEEAVFEPVETDVPTLVVTGEFDQITPVPYGEEIAEALPNATLLEVTAAGHDPLSTTTDPECGASILVAFLDAPDEEPDTACATSQELAFVSVEEALTALTEGSGGG